MLLAACAHSQLHDKVQTNCLTELEAKVWASRLADSSWVSGSLPQAFAQMLGI